MKRFQIFAWRGRAAGGWSDQRAAFRVREDADKYAIWLAQAGELKHVQVVDLANEEVVLWLRPESKRPGKV